MIQFASYLVFFGKREREKKIEKKTREKKVKKSQRRKKKGKEKNVRKKREEKKKLDLSRINLVPEFGLESVLRTVQ